MISLGWGPARGADARGCVRVGAVRGTRAGCTFPPATCAHRPALALELREKDDGGHRLAVATDLRHPPPFADPSPCPWQRSRPSRRLDHGHRGECSPIEKFCREVWSHQTQRQETPRVWRLAMSANATAVLPRQWPALPPCPGGWGSRALPGGSPLWGLPAEAARSNRLLGSVPVSTPDRMIESHHHRFPEHRAHRESPVPRPEDLSQCSLRWRPTKSPGGTLRADTSCSAVLDGGERRIC